MSTKRSSTSPVSTETALRLMKPLMFTAPGPAPHQPICDEALIGRQIEALRMKLILPNIGDVIDHARRYAIRDAGSSSVAFKTLIWYGYLGLCEAADKYDHREGYKFSVLAFFYIRRSISLRLTTDADYRSDPASIRHGDFILREFQRISAGSDRLD